MFKKHHEARTDIDKLLYSMHVIISQSQSVWLDVVFQISSSRQEVALLTCVRRAMNNSREELKYNSIVKPLKTNLWDLRLSSDWCFNFIAKATFSTSCLFLPSDKADCSILFLYELYFTPALLQIKVRCDFSQSWFMPLYGRTIEISGEMNGGQYRTRNLESEESHYMQLTVISLCPPLSYRCQMTFTFIRDKPWWTAAVLV